MFPQVNPRTGYSHAFNDLHLGGTHSEWWNGVPWGPQKARDVQFHLWALSTGTGPLMNQKILLIPLDQFLSSLEVCSAKRVFRFVCFCVFSQSSTVLNIRSSLWALAQLVSCISTNRQPAATHTSRSKHWFPSTMAGSCTSAQCAICKVTHIKDGFHCVWVQPSGNLAKYICNPIVTPF